MAYNSRNKNEEEGDALTSVLARKLDELILSSAGYIVELICMMMVVFMT